MSYDIVNKELASTWKDISEIKSYVYGKWQTSDSSGEFLRIENKQMNAVQNNILRDKTGVKVLIFE